MRIGKTLVCNIGLRSSSSFANETRSIPESKGLPIIGTVLDILAVGGAPKLHLYIDKRHREHGYIFREKLGNVPGVFISDGNYMRNVFAAEGKYPGHIIPESWAIYNEIYGCKRGLLFMNGEEWVKCRKPLNNIMLKSSDIDYIKASSIVARHLVDQWQEGGNINNLESQLYNWSLEVIAAILMGSETYQQHRKDVLQDIKNLAHTVHQIFIESAALSLMPARLAMKLKLPVWKRFTSAVSSATETGRKLLQIVMTITETYPHRNCLLGKIKDTGIGDDHLSRIVTDLILAAGDTTSYTLQWLLHLLSIHPNIQNIIREELDKIGENEAISCSILKGALREALRLYPVAPFITRYMPDDIIIDGYRIKKGELVLMSLYTSGRDERYFPDSDMFSPRRWLRTSTGYENVINPNASLPFAIGGRSCIGKKIAEIQILVTSYHILKNFDVTTNHEKAISLTLHLISVPEKPINLIMKPRSHLISDRRVINHAFENSK